MHDTFHNQADLVSIITTQNITSLSVRAALTTSETILNSILTALVRKNKYFNFKPENNRNKSELLWQRCIKPDLRDLHRAFSK